MTKEDIISFLKSQKNPDNLAGMSRYGINTSNAFGISIPHLRDLAKKLGKNHLLALELWKTGYHESRILACFIDEPDKVTYKQMNEWVKDFNSWDLCDQCCGNLFDKTKFAYKKAAQWAIAKEEFVKRAGFSMMASLAVHDKKVPDSELMKFLPLIKQESTDERNYVKKAINWALRQIGKRNANLNKEAIKTANEILKLNTNSSRWIAKDALKELKSKAINNRIR